MSTYSRGYSRIQVLGIYSRAKMLYRDTEPGGYRDKDDRGIHRQEE
jgi:hypothetical protein